MGSREIIILTRVLYMIVKNIFYHVAFIFIACLSSCTSVTQTYSLPGDKELIAKQMPNEGKFANGIDYKIDKTNITFTCPTGYKTVISEGSLSQGEDALKYWHGDFDTKPEILRTVIQSIGGGSYYNVLSAKYNEWNVSYSNNSTIPGYEIITTGITCVKSETASKWTTSTSGYLKF